MEDQQRLELLKEIGGSRIYEERRKESKKRNQIIQIVQYLDERLRELDDERAELKNFQQIDNKRKYLQYTIYDKELCVARQKLVEVEVARNNVSEKSTERNKILSDAVEELNELDKSAKDLTREVQSLIREKEALEKQQADAIQMRAQLELDEKDLQEKITGIIKAKEEATKQLELLRREIEESTDELDKIKPLYHKQVREEEDITQGIMERENHLNILYQKQGRTTEFSSKAARDKWLQDVIDEYERALSSNQMQEKKLNDEIDQLKTELDKAETHVKGFETEIAALQSVISQNRDSYNQYRSQRDKLNDERKERVDELERLLFIIMKFANLFRYLWWKENDLANEIDRLKTEVTKAEKNLQFSIPSDIWRGMSSVKRIHKRKSMGKRIKEECFSIFDLLDCEEKYFTAVEIAAGNSLFHLVVENDGTSTHMIENLCKENGGRVTFIPLNTVQAQQVPYPESSDVIPVLKKLRFPHNYSPAFEENPNKYTRLAYLSDQPNEKFLLGIGGCGFNWPAALRRDKVSQNGCMTGGFYDYRHSKLKLRNTIKQNTESIDEKKIELEKKISELVGEQQKADAKLAYDKSALEQLKRDNANTKNQQHSISKVIEKKVVRILKLLLCIILCNLSVLIA
ncbi:hypothetical protein LguiA_012759 [Lonicera macranthoides]